MSACVCVCGMCYKDIGTHTYTCTQPATVQALVTWPHRHFVILWILIPTQAVTCGSAHTPPLPIPLPTPPLAGLSCSYVSSWWRYGYFSCHSKCVRAARWLQAQERPLHLCLCPCLLACCPPRDKNLKIFRFKVGQFFYDIEMI